ncbi:MAG: 16S rRNA (guanine(527)-N(7))-methyltransferase RsmG [Eggerthellaceae bacterium]|nr:16S rRNA (guanine(527)-N(7))-methyltransferase RsmG [Eggerthellaceae bacterium]
MEEDAFIERYLDYILEANKITNLTRIDSPEEARILHIEDSLVALPEIEAAPEGLYADLGTGGGFPGVPVAIKTKREALLVDSVKKKVAIVEKGVESLGLDSQISTFGGRIEELAHLHPEEFSVLSARALSQLPSLVELASPLLKKGGRLVCYKARIEEKELKRADLVANKVGMHRISQRSVLLSDGETARTIIVFEKTSQPKMKLPRRVGLAQHKPLA